MEALGKARKKDIAFYNGQIKTCEFFVSNTLPVTLGRLNAISGINSAVVDISEEGFGSK